MKTMKNIALVVLLGLSLSMYAQRGKGQHGQRSEFTSEQQAVLKTKKMALALDLNEDQQEKLIDLNTKWAEKRSQYKEAYKKQKEAEQKPDADARYERQLQMLDDQLAYQKELEKILNKEQYLSWKEHMLDKKTRMQRCRKGDGKRGNERRES